MDQFLIMKKRYTTLLSIGITLALTTSISNLSLGQCLVSTGPTNNCTYGDAIDDLTINGSTVTNAGCSGSGTGYTFFPTPVWNMQLGSSYPLSMNVGGSQYNQGVRIWIDINNDGIFDPTESVYNSATSALSHTGTVVIPAVGAVATVRMRVMCTYNTVASAAQACTSNIGSYGETEDYLVSLTAAILPNNAEATAVVSPLNGDCGEVSDSLWIQVSNVGSNTLTNIPIETNLTGLFTGTFNDTILSLAPATSVDVFVTNFNSSAGGQLDVQFYLSGGDDDLLNDTLTTSLTLLNSTPLVISGNNTVCLGDSTELTLNIEAGETYTWYQDSMSGAMLGTGDTLWTVPVTGSIDYVVTSSNSCREASGVFSIGSPAMPTASFTSVISNDTVTFVGTATDYTSVMWDFGNGNTDNVLSPTYVYGQTGAFYVCFSAMSDCDTVTYCDTVQSVVSSIGLEEMNKGEIVLYPNPTNGNVTVSYVNMAGSEGNWSLINLDGRLLEQSSLQLDTDTEKKTISLENYPSGTYIFQVSIKQGYTNRMMLIKN